MQKTGALLKERRLGTPSLLDIDSDETRRAFPNQFRSVLLQEPLDRGWSQSYVARREPSKRALF